MPQFDGVSVRGGRTVSESFFNIGSYAFAGTFPSSDMSRSWGFDSFGGRRFGSSMMIGGPDLFGSLDWTSQRGLQPQRPGSGDALFLKTMKGYEAYTTGYDLLFGGSLFKTSLAAIRSVVREGIGSLRGLFSYEKGGENLFWTPMPLLLMESILW